MHFNLLLLNATCLHIQAYAQLVACVDNKYVCTSFYGIWNQSDYFLSVALKINTFRVIIFPEAFPYNFYFSCKALEVIRELTQFACL
jgi:hypothetical protein